MSQVTVNLSKAQKILDRLKTVVKDYNLSDKRDRWGGMSGSQAANYVTVNYAHQGAEAMEQELATDVLDQREHYADYVKLLHDLTTAREALFAGNIKSGVSEILNRIDDQKKIKQMWETIKKGTMKDTSSFIAAENLSEYYTSQCQRHRDLAVEASFVIRRQLYSEQEIEEALLACNKTIDELEDKRDTLNHTYKISFELSPPAVKALGLTV